MTQHPFEADWSDQSGIFDPATFAETVTVIGCGGIGASLLPTLVTMGISKFVLWDPDVVEPRNIASQTLYRPSDIYRPKVEVARDYLLSYGAQVVDVHQAYFTEECELNGGVVIGGVDSMSARQTIWKVVSGSDAELYLDGRIGGEHFSCFAVDPIDGDWYEKQFLFDDDKAAPLPCTQRAIVYPATALGAVMCSHLAHWHKGEELPKIIHADMGEVSFMTIEP